MTAGVGPVRARKLIEAFGAVEAIARAAPADLARIHGLGDKTAAKIAAGLREAAPLAEQEAHIAAAADVRIIALGEPEYPPLLTGLADAPVVLYVRGEPRALARSRSIAIVGSRRCTAYGMEQCERFSAFLAAAGVCIISGGARGIDSAAHRAALRAGGNQGPTVAVMGCGLAHCYPPENHDLFEQILAAGGALVSELPMSTPPTSDTFPSRNRIISGLSLGVLVIEAPKASGSLITARYALDEQGREVMAIPGRIDSPASEGSNELIQDGEAALVMSPADVLNLLESPALHLHRGTHTQRYTAPREDLFSPDQTDEPAPANGAAPSTPPDWMSPTQRRIVTALDSPLLFDELVRATGLAAETLMADLTMLEMRRAIARSGSRFERRAAR